MLPKSEPEPETIPESIPEPAQVQYTQEELPQIPTPNLVSQQPDVIPQRESIQSDHFEAVAPPAAFGNQNGSVAENVPEIVQDVPAQANVNEQIYSNIDYIQQQTQESQAQPEGEQVNSALAGNEDCDLAEYIEDTKIQAIALYDYQASAEDEISFDPNDVITHIEKVSLTFFRELGSSLLMNQHLNKILFIHRLTKAGGAAYVRIDMAYSQPITCKLSSKIIVFVFSTKQ